jgi:hypothetical protein
MPRENSDAGEPHAAEEVARLGLGARVNAAMRRRQAKGDGFCDELLLMSRTSRDRSGDRKTSWGRADSEQVDPSTARLCATSSARLRRPLLFGEVGAGSLRDRHARFARPDKGPAGGRAVATGGGVARSSSGGRRATNASTGAPGFLKLPRMKASSVACVLSEPGARGACRADKGGGVSAISAHSCRCGSGLGAFGDAVCIFARAITASQSSSFSAGAAAGRKRAATRCSGTFAMSPPVTGSAVTVRYVR